ncbi:LysR substrate-binding domain-containing protein [Aromatoleum evansii]|uniref:LysR substrate-binding domain-containing protein n=1 Tax=Aromatoleum evansii TaxID=59406 RepID=A0ABZ1AI40_AROEV|nr:LysR substrate-binding domain-containing protein [Aromatoleum evansii]
MVLRDKVENQTRLNRRLLCASPAYLKSRGRPDVPADLRRDDCIVVRQNESACGVWRLARGKEGEAEKVHGKLSTNDGEVALNWALDGHGILMRSDWDIAEYLRSGRLQQVLADYETPAADIYAVYLERLNLSAKVSFFVEHLREYLSTHADSPESRKSAW